MCFCGKVLLLAAVLLVSLGEGLFLDESVAGATFSYFDFPFTTTIRDHNVVPFQDLHH